MLAVLLLAGGAKAADWLLVQRAHAAEVRGQLVLGSLHEVARAKPPRPACNWELENGVKEVLPTRVAAQRELAVVLLGTGEPKASDSLEVSVVGGTLMPTTLALRTGTTLRIRNDDEIGHELFAQGLDGFSASKPLRPVRRVRCISSKPAAGRCSTNSRRTPARICTCSQT